MAEITLNRQQSEMLLASGTGDASSRLVAAMAIAFFETGDSAEDADRESIYIAQKLLHMIQQRIYEATGTTDQAVES